MTQPNPEILATGVGWIAVNKPCGPAMHGEPGDDLLTLVGAMLAKDKVLQGNVRCDKTVGLHPVHRLDRDTSGLVLLAGRVDVLRWLTTQFEQCQVVKRYLTMVHGPMEPQADALVWNSPLSHRPGGRDNPAGNNPKVAARTRIQVLATSRHYSMLICELETGRKHQIRRHAALGGHPVVGDRRYSTARALHFLEQVGFHRLALHSAHLRITLPGQDEPTWLPMAPLPKSILDLFASDGGSLEWVQQMNTMAAGQPWEQNP
jgi:tRNA pseudouridine65 synthase